MSTNPRQQAQLGDLIVAAFDGAAEYSTDPQEVSRLATRTVTRMLRHGAVLPRAVPRSRSGGRRS